MIQLKIARYEHQNSYTISRRSDKEQSVTKYGTFEELVCLSLAEEGACSCNKT
jgi:hypothetical protein